MIRRVLFRFLKKEGYILHEAEDAETALSTFNREQPFDAVLCDIYLGQDCGWRVAQSIRALQPDVGIVMLSGALTTKSDLPRPRFRRLQKPFSPEDLMTELKAAFGGTLLP